MSDISLPIMKALFARSRNECAFPGCSLPVIEESDTVTGEICHIRAVNPGGPRYDETQTDRERNASANLVLMCGRHHKIIDREFTVYTTEKLTEIKRQHEIAGVAEISQQVARGAQLLLAHHLEITINGNHGNIAIQSPGVIQAKQITIKHSRSKLSIEAPPGSIGAARSKAAHCQYLIDRYNKYQEADTTGKDDFKFMAIHLALNRKFKPRWKLVEEARFKEVAGFLEARIDNTVQGRINRSRGRANYHAFEVA